MKALPFAVLIALALAAGGCGGGSSHNLSPTPVETFRTSPPGETAWPGNYNHLLSELRDQVPGFEEHLIYWYTSDMTWGIVIGVDSDDVRLALERELEKRGLPTHAVKVERGERAVLEEATP